MSNEYGPDPVPTQAQIDLMKFKVAEEDYKRALRVLNNPAPNDGVKPLFLDHKAQYKLVDSPALYTQQVFRSINSKAMLRYQRRKVIKKIARWTFDVCAILIVIVVIGFLIVGNVLV